MRDALIEQLRSARPILNGDAITPPSGLLEGIVSSGGPQLRARHPRRRHAGLMAVAAVITAALLALPRGSAPVDIELVASRSRVALAGTGRAEITFSTGKEQWARRGTTRVAFVGDDLEMTIDFAPDGRSPGFQARNKTVDGEFYLLDGVPGRKGWFHDTNSSGAKRSDLFSLDPRSLLALLEPSAQFEDVGADLIDGVDVRRLRATDLDETPVLNLGLGPTDGQDAVKLEVWVDADDIVRRIDLDFSTTTTEGGSLLVKREDGSVEEVHADLPQETRSVETRSSYSVRFFDLGEQIEIVAPEGAVDIAAKG